MRTLHFLSGLPRSGSTLLANILCQNPRFHVTPTSGLAHVLSIVRNQWDRIPEFLAAPQPSAKKNVLYGILESFHLEFDIQTVVFDKSRAWPALIELVEELTGHPVKIVATVRDIPDILSSLEKLYRRDSRLIQPMGEAQAGPQMQTILGRCKFWSDSSQLVGSAFNTIKDAVDRGLRDRIHFVEFRDLTERPDKALANLYAWLDEEPFEHKFDDVQQTTKEEDRFHGFTDLHTIRPEVKPVKSDWRHVIGEAVGNQFRNAEFWKTI